MRGGIDSIGALVGDKVRVVTSEERDRWKPGEIYTVQADPFGRPSVVSHQVAADVAKKVETLECARRLTHAVIDQINFEKSRILPGKGIGATWEIVR
jgi:hypothetical protein